MRGFSDRTVSVLRAATSIDPRGEVIEDWAAATILFTAAADLDMDAGATEHGAERTEESRAATEDVAALIAWSPTRAAAAPTDRLRIGPAGGEIFDILSVRERRGPPKRLVIRARRRAE